MSEYTNDAYMMLGRGANSSIYAVTFGARAVLQLIQFFRRLSKEMILNGGEVEKFERFVKATDIQRPAICRKYARQPAFRHTKPSRCNAYPIYDTA